MKSIYKEIQNRINIMDFDKLWPGFTPYEFALYNDEKVYFETFETPISNQFVGNTSINFEGKQIAIWKIEEKDLIDTELLTASIIHEMFHAHQMTSGDNRFFNDLDGLSYPIEYENFNLKVNESKFLASAITEQNFKRKEEFFKKFLAIRQRRFELSIDYKKAIEPDLLYNYDLVTEKYSVTTNMVIELDENIEIHRLIDERNIKVRELVNGIIASSNVEIMVGEFSVRGYDPMNMMRSDHFVYHKHFLGIHQNGETDFVMGPIVIETDGKDFSKFSRYYKISNN